MMSIIITPAASGFDLSKYQPLYKRPLTYCEVGRTWYTALQITGNGFITTCATLGKSFITVYARITIDGNVIYYGSITDTTNAFGIIHINSVGIHNGSKYLIDSSIIPFSDVGEYPNTSGNGFVCLISTPIFFSKSFLLEVQCDIGNENILSIVRGGVK